MALEDPLYFDSSRRITTKGIDLIKKFEGFSSDVYTCPSGYETIGYGHLIQESESFNDAISKEEAEKLLRVDVRYAEMGVLNLIHVPMTNNQFDALVSFTFNLGIGALQRSTLRKKVNLKLNSEVAHEFSRWTFAKGKRLKGLMLRRKIESDHYFGVDQDSEQEVNSA